MASTVADHVLDRLRAWDMDTVFGYAGDGINGLLAAWDRRTADGMIAETAKRGAD